MSTVSLDSLNIPEAIKPLAVAVIDKPDAVRRLAKMSLAMQDRLDATENCLFALALRRHSPNDAVVNFITSKVLSPAVPGWNFACIDDMLRNEVFQNALYNLVTPETLVLDVGAGCGILALFAARAGAKHVYAIEIEPIVAQIAQEIVDRNGFSDKITIICKDICKVKVGVDIPEKCNLVLQDVIWPDPMSRKINVLLDYSREHLLTQDAIYCPETITAVGALSDADESLAWPDYADVLGMDLSPMQLLSPRISFYVRGRPPKRLLSEPFEVAHYDLRTADAKVDFVKTFEVKTNRAGQVQHLLRWLKWTFPDGSVLENGPLVDSARALITYKVYDPIEVKTGQTLQVKVEDKTGTVLTTLSED